MDYIDRSSLPYETDSRRMVIRFWVLNGDTSESQIEIPGKFEVCGHCSGRGSHSQHLGVIQRDDWDDDEFDDYMSGRYDMRCEICKGERVVLVPANDDPRFDAMMRQHWADERERLAEIRMGA